MRIKLHDVASRAGVSEATVSRVINGKPGVKDATRASVLEVLAGLGYQPSALRTAERLGLVGLIVPELDNPIFPAFAQALESRLLRRGYVSVLCCAGRIGAAEEDYVPTLVDRGAAGIIIVSGRHADTGGNHDIYRSLLRQRVPLVFVNGQVAGLDVPSVSCDEEVAASIAVEHLAHLGHRRVGFLTGPTVYVPVIRRLRGYRASVAASGLDDDPELVSTTVFSVAGGRAGAEHLLAAGATAIVAASDMMALGAVHAARDAGFLVPQDISVIGYDDTDLMAFTDPPLTTLRQPVAAIAEHAVEVLLAQVAGQPFRTTEYLVRPELIVRGSTARNVTTSRVPA
jgi:LacI family transcriptional regulator, repressor for deo operon, udp, cdd, tsx, nupC, and nupG